MKKIWKAGIRAHQKSGWFTQFVKGGSIQTFREKHGELGGWIEIYKEMFSTVYVFSFSGWTSSVCWLSTCSRMELILSTSQSMRKRFSCRRSISSMMRLYSVGSTMFPTERAVTCQLLATADSMMAWRMAKPAGAEGEELHHTRILFVCFRAQNKKGAAVWLSTVIK